MISRTKSIAIATAAVAIITGAPFLWSPVHERNGQTSGTLRKDDTREALSASSSYDLPSTDGGRPLPFARQTTSNRSTLVRNRFLKLAGADRYNAIDAALRLTGADRDLALATLSAAWKTDPRPGYKELSRIIDQLSAYGGAMIVFGPGTTPWHTIPAGLISSLGAFSVFPNDPELPLLTMRLANRLLDGPKHSALVNAAAKAYTSVDPSLAFSFGNTLSGMDYENFVDTFSKQWASQNPEAAAEWSSSIGDPDMRARVLANAVSALARSNPDRAAQWLDTLPDGGARQTAIRELGSTWARQDTAAALAWAEQLPRPEEQQQGTAAIQSIAPIGVGIALGRPSASGYPTAMDLVPSGPAARAGGVQPGDQIVAVTNLDSQWVDTQNMSLNEVVSMIRGSVGDPVQLRLLPPGATDPSQARVVTIVRQQLLFKRQSGS